jgi:hypothetical protein
MSVRGTEHAAGSGEGQGPSVRDRARMIYEHCGGEKWKEAKAQGGGGNCPLCGGGKLSVGVGKTGNVAVTCWSPDCRPDPEARAKIVARLVGDGFYLGPDDPAPPGGPAGKKARAPRPILSAKQVIDMKPSERRLLLALAPLAADRNGWITTTKRKLADNAHVSSRDAIPMLRRIQTEHNLIEVQKNSYALKRATKVSFFME